MLFSDHAELPELRLRSSGRQSTALENEKLFGSINWRLVSVSLALSRPPPTFQHRAYNIKSGDQLLAIVGFPLDWRTLTQLRYGLLTSPEVQTLKSNANLFELAEHLLDKPYQRSVRNNKDGSSEQIEAPNLIVARNPRLAKQRESQAEDTKYKAEINALSDATSTVFYGNLPNSAQTRISDAGLVLRKLSPR
ncbi:hypothetical protein CSKR_202613, partial [Clonorchis sinensis]